MFIPDEISWIYDFEITKKGTSNQKLAAIFSPILPQIQNQIYYDYKSIIINQDKLYIFMTSKRPCIDNKG